MGLVVTLDPSAHGGVEKPLGVGADDSMAVDETSQNANVAGPSTVPQKTTSTSKSSSVPSGFGKIIRDAEGNVLRIELPTEEEEEEQEVKEQEMDMEEELESRMDADVRAKWSTNFSGSTAVQGAAGKGKAKTEVVGSECLPLIFFSSSRLGIFDHESWWYFWRPIGWSDGIG
ncbi:hypothetical protein D9619_005844 [Psilocybe cf. subviscida]|uniref:Uncharacterized protein n=1 Tax=Psilocybe cf. subviscida TaxID=2480587 RepID=A0A8H5FBI7_9AGAR|nr:hypothetical protein D9619_005844 [Psilocybe cf. subviscida]